MGGSGQQTADELRISPELLEHLFRPLQDVLKENGSAVIELSDQMKVIVTLATAHPTRQFIADALSQHNTQALEIKKSIEKLDATLVKYMWVIGIVWAAVEFIQSYHHIFK